MADIILKTLFINSVIFTILFVSMLLVRKLMTKHISAVLQYALWAAVVLKLAVPFGFESSLSPLGLFVAPGNSSAVTEQTSNNTVYTANGNIDNENTGEAAQTETAASEKILFSTGASIKQNRDRTPSWVWQLSWETLVLIIWAIGALTTGTVRILCSTGLKRRVRHSARPVSERVLNIIESCRSELGLERHVEMITQSAVSTPATIGAFRPILILPDNIETQTDAQIRHICLHELTHVKYRDLTVINIMGILRAVYWFNPLVWLCFIFIRRDMEAACDSRVIKRLGGGARKEYIGTVLQFAMRDDKVRICAAAGMTDGRLSMEQRIKSMFRKTRTGAGSRFAAAFIALLMFITCALTACQPTPSSTPVVNKGDNHLEEMIASSAVSESPSGSTTNKDSSDLAAELRSETGAPETLKDSYTNKKGDVRVAIDAKVEVPSVENIPALEVETADFTQSMVDKLAAYFLKNTSTYSEEQVRTKDDIAEEIVQEQQELEEMKDDKKATGVLQSQLSDLKKQYNASPETRKRTPATTKLNTTKDGTQLMLVADMGKDGEASFNAFNVNNKEYAGSEFSFIDDGKGNYDYESEMKVELKGTPRGMTTTLEDAQKEACQCLSDLGIENMQVDTVSAGIYLRTFNDINDKAYVSTAKQCYVFEFQKIVYGIPVLNIEASTPMGTDDPSVPEEEEPQYTNVVGPESLTVYIDDTGVVSFMWKNPSDEESVLSDHVTLMKFDDIAKKARDNMFYKNYTAYGSTCDIKITSVELSMMRVMEKDKPGRYMIVPVWDFIGNNGLPFGDQSFVTINAIDGSNINRQWGY